MRHQKHETPASPIRCHWAGCGRGFKKVNVVIFASVRRFVNLRQPGMSGRGMRT